MIRVYGLALVFAASPLAAQDTLITSPIDGSSAIIVNPEPESQLIRAVQAPGATLRGLDKVSGEVVDLPMGIGETAELGRIKVTLGECRYPEDNPAGEAFAWVEIEDPLRSAAVFSGWMIASSPALNALDHARYDVWVVRCNTA